MVTFSIAHSFEGSSIANNAQRKLLCFHSQYVGLGGSLVGATELPLEVKEQEIDASLDAALPRQGRLE